MTFQETIYALSPPTVQSLLVSAYGWQQSRSRFSGEFSAQLQLLQQHQQLPEEQLKHWQNQQLQQLIGATSRSVPYCQEVLKKANLSPDDINIDNFTSIFPILDKQSILADPAFFCSSEVSEQQAIKLFTSGTSGSPLAILSNKAARQKNYAFYEALLRNHGLHYRQRSVTFAGRTVVPQGASRQFWRKDYYNRTLYCSSFHLGKDSIPAYIKAMEAWQPAFIDSYPSAIGEVARYIVDRGINHQIRPKLVLTSSETLLASQRDAIERAFRCPLIDQYGCTEMAVWAVSENGQYRIDPTYCLTELEPVAGDLPVPVYELISTGLLNPAMPLFRYRIGDCVSSSTPPSEQSFQNLRFDQVLGREDDMIVTAEGHRVGRLDPVFKGIEGIREAQIIQHTLEELEVLIAPSQREAINLELLESNIRARTSQSMQIAFSFTDSIPKTAAGKFKSVVSRLNQAR